MMRCVVIRSFSHDLALIVMTYATLLQSHIPKRVSNSKWMYMNAI
jgi:hypothetical protein